MDILEVFQNFGIPNARMITKFRFSYLNNHPGDLVLFNANIVIEPIGKVWYGDLNVTSEFETLKEIADTLGTDLYVLSENDCRWGEENKPLKILKDKAKVIIKSKQI
jgi:hypothetical protein